MAEQLTVVLYGSVTGRLSRDVGTGRLSFRYDGEYLNSPVPVPLSLRLPLDEAVYGARRMVPYLEGLLPEDPGTRRRWADMLGVDRPDAFNLLAGMGADCPGAVQFVPAGNEKSLTVRNAGLVELGETEIAARLRRLAADPASWVMTGEHWSLAGQQSKFALARHDGRWFQATGSAPTTHIVKPGIGRLRHQALVEHATMRAARAAGVDVAPCELWRFEDQTAVVAERFDRVRGADGRILRVHQEDFCSATGRVPDQKYEAEGGPMLRDMMRAVAAYSTAPSDDALAILDFLAVNYLAGAPDGHSKNIALLILPGQVRVAPLYDLATAFPYDRRGPFRVAQSIGGKRRIGEVKARHWENAALILGLPGEQVRQRVIHLAEVLPFAFSDALAEIGTPAAGEIAGRSVDKLAAHCGETAGSLARADAKPRVRRGSPRR